MLLEATDIMKTYPARDGGGRVHAINGVSLKVERGKTLGIVGESGCGKSTLARVLMRLIEPDSGDVRFEDESFMKVGYRRLQGLRRHIQIVHQDPYASLDPRMSARAIISEPLEIHDVGTVQSRRQRVSELLSLVGLAPDAGDKYPHEFSGGQRQRICIARAIALEPKLIILDEPVSALDVSIQAQILNLLVDLRMRLGLTYILISHDLSVVRYLSDEVAVMYSGKIVEQGPADVVFGNPLHPYTQALISAVPELTPNARRGRIVLSGEPPSPEHLPSGCAFHPRCFNAVESCKSLHQPLRSLATQRVACMRAGT